MPTAKKPTPAYTVKDLLDHTPKELESLVTTKRITQALHDEVLAAKAKEKEDLELAKKTNTPVGVGNGQKSKPSKVAAITLEDFQNLATPLQIDLNGPQFLVPRTFDKGSYGYGLYGKVNLKIGDKIVPCQATFNLTVIGSKPE